MASVYKRENSRYYTYRFNHKGKHYRGSTGQTTERKAREVLKRRMAEVRGHGNVDGLIETFIERLADLPPDEAKKKRMDAISLLMTDSGEMIPLAEAWKIASRHPNYARGEIKDRTLEAYESYWKSFSKWMSQHYPSVRHINEVNKKMAEKYLAQLRGKMAPATYDHHLMELKRVFEMLKDQTGLLINVWEGFKSMPAQKENKRNLDREELKTIIDRAERPLRSLLMLGLFSGARLGDCVLLKWSENKTIKGRKVRLGVDFKNKVIRFMPAKTARLKKIVEIPMHDLLAAELKSLPCDNEYVFPEFAAMYDRNRAAVSKVIQNHMESCGIKTTRKPEGHRQRVIVEVGFHSLRHSFVSLCASSGVPQHITQALVGHGSPAMTSHYTHETMEDKQNAIKRLNHEMLR